MAGQVDVLACGLATLDLIQYVDTMPAPDQKVVAGQTLLDPGGPATNAARTAAALGSTTCLVTLLGASAIAATVRAQLARERVDVVDARPDLRDWTPPLVAVTVDAAGRRSVVSATTAGAPEVRKAAPLPTARVVLLDGHHLELALAVAAEQRGRGTTVVLDGGSWKTGLERLLPLIDVAVLSADFRTPQEHAAALTRIPAVAVTAGDRPIRLRTPAALGEPGEQSGSDAAHEDEIPVPPVAVVDTLGAGDVLHGALCHELASDPARDRRRLVAALTAAAEVASRSCRFHGALTWATAGRRGTGTAHA